MKSYCFAFAALAAIGFSGAAFAEEANATRTVESKPATSAPQAMSDSDMDKVTAGHVIHIPHGPFAGTYTVGRGCRGPKFGC